MIKESLRREFLERRQGVSAQARRAASAKISSSLISLAEFEQSAGIAAFWPLAEEVDVRLIVDAARTIEKRVYLPRVNKNRGCLEFSIFAGDPAELAPGPFGILQPTTPGAPLEEIDLVIVPALAYDLRGHRLGYGAGYYDRFLKTVKCASIGVTFDAQTIDILPTKDHDVAVDLVVTESRVF